MTGPLSYCFRAPDRPNTLFLDRDGVLNEPVLRSSGVSSPRTIEEFRVAPDISALAEEGIRKDWNLVMVSNQPDLGRGMISVAELECFHGRINEKIALHAAYVCPHTAEEACDCRKPKTGLLEKFYGDFPRARGKCCFVGDRRTDLECAQAAGIPFILRKREYNRELAASEKIVAVSDLFGLAEQL